jgi:hypothetical protein
MSIGGCVCKRVFSYVCLTSSMNRASLTLVVFLPRDTCSAFMLLVFCSFDKTVHAAITVCTWLYIMWCPSNWRTRAQPIISYVIPLMIPSRLVTCTYSRENFRSPLFFFKAVLIDFPVNQDRYGRSNKSRLRHFALCLQKQITRQPTPLSRPLEGLLTLLLSMLV